MFELVVDLAQHCKGSDQSVFWLTDCVPRLVPIGPVRLEHCPPPLGSSEVWSSAPRIQLLLWGGYLASQSLSLLICKMGLIPLLLPLQPPPPPPLPLLLLLPMKIRCLFASSPWK